MSGRKYNFSPGPAVLPLPALEKAQQDLVDFDGSGIGILGNGADEGARIDDEGLPRRGLVPRLDDVERVSAAGFLRCF